MSDREVRGILRAMKKNSRITLNQLATQTIPGPTISMALIRQVLRRNCFKYCLPSGRLFLKTCHKIKRKLWAKTHENHTTFDWATVIWSDESHFEIGFSTREQPQ